MFDQINVEDHQGHDVEYQRECLKQRTRFRNMTHDHDDMLHTLIAFSGKPQHAEHALHLFYIIRLSFGMPVSENSEFKTSAMHIAKLFIDPFRGELDDSRLFRLGADVRAADEDGDEQMVAWHLINFVMTACPRRIVAIRHIVDGILRLLSHGQ